MYGSKARTESLQKGTLRASIFFRKIKGFMNLNNKEGVSGNRKSDSSSNQK